MKRFFLIFSLIFALCLALFFVSSRSFVSEGPSAEKGILDFTGADFTSSVYALQGQWELYYEELYTPEELKTGMAKGRELIELPGPWTKVGYPKLGYATFRLTVRVGNEEGFLLYIPEIMSASVIWVNGKEFYRAGQVGTSMKETVTGVRNELLSVSPQNGVIELVVQAANYQMNGSGLFYPVLFGRDTVLIHHLFWQRVILAAALGGILLIGFYHLVLYFFRRRERLYLIFSATCLTAVFRLGMESNGLVQYFRPEGIGFLLSRVFLLLFTVHSFCIFLFMVQAFSLRLGRALKLIVFVCFGLPVLSICVLPYATAVASMFTVTLPYCIGIVLVLRSGKITRDPYQLLYLCSMIIFVIYGPMSKTIFEGDAFVPGVVPNVFLILSQCVMLARSYAKAHDEVERVNANLEELVEKRTEQLSCANQQLASSQAALREMISNISHDLKTPLTVLNNYLELLGDQTIEASEQEREEYLGIAYHKNLDLQRLVHNLFEVTRMEGGTVVYQMEWISGVWLAEQAREKYADQCRDCGIEFLVKADRGLEVKLDNNKIWNIFDNLVYNAIRYTPKGGKISLSLERDGEKARIRVSDTGEGIASDHLPHIFERFYKVSPERGEKDGSSGLGLYIVKNLVEGMGGVVQVESKPGKGTVFILIFLAK